MRAPHAQTAGTAGFAERDRVCDAEHTEPVDVQIAEHAPVTGYSEGDTTRYNVFVRCANGYSASGALVYGTNWVPIDVEYAGDLHWSVEAPSGAAAGACTVTTYDVASLRLHQAAKTLLVDPTSGTSDWWVTFAG